jgi:hypothetical protein
MPGSLFSIPTYSRTDPGTFANAKFEPGGLAQGRKRERPHEPHRNFWSLLKRGLKGTYVSVEPFHLFRYLDEQAFRYNERRETMGIALLRPHAPHPGDG